ncbi:Phosphoglycerate mutase 1 [Senna tora]|uniref:phosphoglycerate mutase (2,3-diphosphoglycerate-dependent) n=1 Tax=Senna tora TaxID=362788 RepID=A0A834X8I9_9FABA|nr:Phosphoglycerate mutase 1 [Senna tora]
MGNRGLLLVALCFCIVGSVISSEGGQVAKPFRVQGRVYCDNCRAGFETNITTYISGAKVRVVCKNRTSLAGVFSVEGETDSSGTYDIVVEHDHDDEICEVLFVSSPVLDCKTPDPGRNKSSIVLTRSNNGILNNLHYANSLGCFKDSVGPGLHGWGIDASGNSIQLGNFSVKFLSSHFGGNTGLFRQKVHTSSQHKLHPIHGSISYSSATDPTSLNNSVDISQDSSNETALILIRHGESLWNEKNLFTGCVDVPLTKRGVEEAIEAGKRISYIPVDVIFTSTLIRAQMTAMLAMTQHCHKKVPIIIHNESEQAKTWTQVFSEKTKKQSIPVITSWQLNERMYGELQGLNKQETAERYGKEKVHEWRRSYDIPPPSGESLEMCSHRAVAYFKDCIEPQLKAGRHVMVAAHGNSLRSIIMYLDRLSSQEVISLELSTGIPLLYIFKDGNFIKRGSPVGLTEAGVYAYTKLNKRAMLFEEYGLVCMRLSIGDNMTLSSIYDDLCSFLVDYLKKDEIVTCEGFLGALLLLVFDCQLLGCQEFRPPLKFVLPRPRNWPPPRGGNGGRYAPEFYETTLDGGLKFGAGGRVCATLAEIFSMAPRMASKRASCVKRRDSTSVMDNTSLFIEKEVTKPS